MYNYIVGKIVDIESSYIVVDNNNIGYNVYTPNPYSFNLDENYKVYIYENIREDEHTLYGFKDLKEKELFLKLIEVKGLGCKMALPMLALGEVKGIEEAIERENILYLKKFPKIGDKVARQIILDLKGKLVNKDTKIETNNELVEVLKGLGYKNQDISRILPNIDKNSDIESQIKEALKLMLK